jgi:hypothetical protein
MKTIDGFGYVGRGGPITSASCVFGNQDLYAYNREAGTLALAAMPSVLEALAAQIDPVNGSIVEIRCLPPINSRVRYSDVKSVSFLDNAEKKYWVDARVVQESTPFIEYPTRLQLLVDRVRG